jgi:hypothetical protein
MFMAIGFLSRGSVLEVGQPAPRKTRRGTERNRAPPPRSKLGGNRVANGAVIVDSGPMRTGDGEDLLAGYVTGPAAASQATALALDRADRARVVVLVEGVSDQIAVETLARRHGRDLAAEGVTVLPIGGAHGAARYLRRFGPQGTGARIAGLCDHAEAHIVRRGLATAGLATAGLGPPGSTGDLERLGFYVCVEDLEDELIRAAGPALVLEVFAAHGDLTAFRTIQRQPAWRGRDAAAQLRRFLGAGAQRKLRYARLLTEAIELDRMPRPLTALLAAV